LVYQKIPKEKKSKCSYKTPIEKLVCLNSLEQKELWQKGVKEYYSE
jgi:hypothetical protein